MSIPNEALQKILVEIEQKAAFSQQQISIVKSQMAAKSRESRMLQLTAKEVEALPTETNVYEGVGKMFIQTPAPTVQQRLKSETEKLAADMVGLEKKLHYLETTYKNSVDNLEQLLGRSRVS